MCLCVPRCTRCIRCSQMSTEVRRGHQMLWNWNYSWNCNRSSQSWARVLRKSSEWALLLSHPAHPVDICFLRKTPWLRTLLSCLLHSSPMRHIVLSVASVPSLCTRVFLFSRPYCPTDSPHDNSHTLPHHSWREHCPVSAYVCTKLL